MDDQRDYAEEGIHIAPGHTHEEFVAFYYAQRDEVEREWQQLCAMLPSDYFDIPPEEDDRDGS